MNLPLPNNTLRATVAREGRACRLVYCFNGELREMRFERGWDENDGVFKSRMVAEVADDIAITLLDILNEEAA